MVLRILFQFFPTFDSCTLIYFPILVFVLYSLPLCTFAPFPLYPHSPSSIYPLDLYFDGLCMIRSSRWGMESHSFIISVVLYPIHPFPQRKLGHDLDEVVRISGRIY